MFIVYSKQTGDIKNIVTGSTCKSIKDLFPRDYKDYELIYECINLEDDSIVINNQDIFKIENNKIVLKENEFSKYNRKD